VSGTLHTDASGASTTVYAIDFGNHSGIMPLSAGTFKFAASSAHSFVMPRDVIVDSIFMTAANLSFTPASTVAPYVILATAPDNSNLFTLLQATRTPVATPYIQRTAYPENTIRSGFLDGIGVTITAGTRVAIVGGMTTAGGTQLQAFSFFFTGGILLL
jgi:hypothetical protein